MSSIFDRVGIGARKAKFEAERQKDILALQTKIRPLHGEMDKVYSQLGKAAFELYLAGQLDQPELTPIAGRLASLQAQITQIEKEIEDLRIKEFVEVQAGEYGYICPNGHGPLPQGNNFCTQCGAKPIYVPPPKPQPPVAATFCQNCGQPIGADAQFCAHCGHAVAQPQPPQPAPVETPNACTHCGEPLLPDAAFCAECGTPVAATAPVEIDTTMPPVTDYEPSEEVLFPPEPETEWEEEIADAGVDEAFEEQLAALLEEEVTPSFSTEETTPIKDELSAVDLPEVVEQETGGVEEEITDISEESEIETTEVDEIPVDRPQVGEVETASVEEAVEQLESDVPEMDVATVEPIVAAEAKAICANCGEELLPDAIFCAECGQPVADEAETIEEPIVNSEPLDESEIDSSDPSTMLMTEESSDQEESEKQAADAPVASTGFCTNCGAVLLPEAIFCAECGQRVE